ncbi:MAG: iron transporter [Deltaproteobacteria bacterium]|nr:MAG: iron transporter [Deltaproteobacteria bacterium]
MTNKISDTVQKIKLGIRKGLTKGWKGLVWLLKIIIPISFATTLLVHFEIIYKLDFLLTPVMTWISLPASAALVLIIGLFTGIYGTVAALSVMPFSIEHMTLIAIYTLISHNIIQESIVQGNSGINTFFAAFFRLFMAFVVTFICAKIMGITPETGGLTGAEGFAREPVPFMVMLKTWGWETFKLIIQIFCIIMPLMVILELAKTFNIISFITKMTSPVLSIMGLNRSTGMLWLTASIFGLAYGAAVIVEETQSNAYKKEDLIKLHLSIGINHSMIEDPVLFLPLGLPIFWLWIPRLAAAIIVTWLYTVFLSARRHYAKRACHKKLCNH